MRYIDYLVNEQYGSVGHFAEICDIPKCTMYHYFKGLRFPNTHNFMTMADKLHVSAEFLYDSWYREVEL